MPRPKPQLPNFLNVRDFAERMSVSEKTVRRWIASGELRHHRLGNSIRIADEDASVFFAARRR